MKPRFNKVFDFIVFVMLIVAIYFAYLFFEENNFSGYSKNVEKSNITIFKRDNDIKYGKQRSMNFTDQ